MKRSDTRVGGRHLLMLCEQADQLAQRVKRSPRSSAKGRLEGRRKAAVKALQKAMKSRSKDRLHDALDRLAREHGLEAGDVIALLFLFNRRVRSQAALATGREIVEACALGEDEALAAAATLHPDHPLVSKGLVETEAHLPEDALDAPYRMSESCFTALYRAYHGLPETPEAEGAPPYPGAAEHFSDWRLLLEIARRRAQRVFPRSGWADGGTADDIGLADLLEGFRRISAAVRLREENTPESVRLPFRDLRRKVGLKDEEILMLVALLAQELYTTRGTIDLMDLARLGSESEDDVPLMRRLVAASGRLRGEGLMKAESEFEDRDLFGTAWLPEAVVDQLLEGQDGTGPISDGEKSRFREWIAGISHSGEWFDRFGTG
ncbi:MAG: hypothetical protein RIS21_1144 [Planctomycetota bacterium]|jgi:hypothetical protein